MSTNFIRFNYLKLALLEDLKNFLKIVISNKCTSYSTYKKLFEHHGMAAIFNGLPDDAEIMECNEYVLRACLTYVDELLSFGIPRTFEERLFGVFSLYTFFFLQTPNRVVKIRMDTATCLQFQNFATELKMRGYFDAYACCLRLFENEAITLVISIDMYDPLFAEILGEHDDENVEVANPSVPFSNIRNIINSDEFEKLDAASEFYKRFSILSPDIVSNIKNPVAEATRLLEKYESDGNRIFDVSQMESHNELKDSDQNVEAEHNEGRVFHDLARSPESRSNSENTNNIEDQLPTFPIRNRSEERGRTVRFNPELNIYNISPRGILKKTKYNK